MAEIIDVTDLSAAVQSNELVAAMVAGANAQASRVAPCLTDPTSTVWAAETDYEEGDQVVLQGGEFLEAIDAGTSDATEPTAPDAANTVEDGTVTWQRIGPVPDQLAEAKLLLIGAVTRWAEAGSGAIQQQTAGPFGMTVDTRQKSSGYRLWPSEIEGLQDICSSTDDESGKAFSVDTAPSLSGQHVPWCSYNLGAAYCSCGTDIAGEPIYELD